MISGHGDDLHKYDGIVSNFSSNIYAGFCHKGLFGHLCSLMNRIANYPEPSAHSLEEALASFYRIPKNCVMAANGATEAIYLIAEAFRDFVPVIPQPTFSEYADACRDCSGEPGGRSLRWLCIPNNPTGHVMPKCELLDLIAQKPNDIFVIDASYAGYTREEVLTVSEAVSMGNVLMLRSMTKDYGVPGIRLGFVVGNSDLLGKVRAKRMPWSVNALAIEAGLYLLAHHSEYEIPLEMLIGERSRMERELNARGIETCHSDSHMLLCLLPDLSAGELKEYLAGSHGILIRDAGNFETLTDRHFRIAVQSKEQNSKLLEAVDLFYKM